MKQCRAVRSGALVWYAESVTGSGEALGMANCKDAVMTAPHHRVPPPPLLPPPPMRAIAPPQIPTGRWYFVVAVCTFGMCAWVPFLHAAQRLGTPQIRRWAALYGGAALVFLTTSGLTPTDAAGKPVGVLGTVLQSVTVLLAIGTVVGACIQLAPLRREVYLNRGPAPQPSPVSVVDPAVGAVLWSRTRRAEARSIVAKDPLMARDLRIGRPDLERAYDDGGLVDLNRAPAVTIAATCGIPVAIAELIVQARHLRGGTFLEVNEALILAEIPVQVWDHIRDRAVLVP